MSQHSPSSRSAWLLAVVCETIVLLGLIAWAWWPTPAHTDIAPTKAPDDLLAAATVTAGLDAPSQSAASPSASRREVATASATLAPVVFGRVVDAANQPVDGAYVSFSKEAVARSAQVKGGRYAAIGLTLGPWKIAVRADGYRLLQDQIELSSADTRRDFTLRKAVTLAVRLQTEDGKPFESVARSLMEERKLSPRAEPHAIAAMTALPTALPMSDTRSTWGIGVGDFHSGWFSAKSADRAKDWIGDLILDAELPVHVGLMLRQQVLAQQVVLPGATEVLFQFPMDRWREKLGSVHFSIVRASTGQPLAGGRVQLMDMQGGMMMGGPPAGSDILLEGIPPGEWQLNVWAKDHASWDQRVRVNVAENVDLGTIALHDMQTLKGVVLGVDGKPVAAELRWDCIERITFPQKLRNNHSSQANAEGEFSLPVGRGRYALRAVLQGADTAAANVLVDTRTSLPADLRLQLLPTFAVRVDNRVDKLDSVLLSIRTKDGLPVLGEEVRSTGDVTWRLPRGDYLAEIHRDLVLVRSFELRVDGDGARLSVP